MPRHNAIDDAITPEERLEYEALIRQPGTTVDEARAWMMARGKPIARGSVHRHMRAFRAALKEIHRSAEFSAAFVAVLRQYDIDDISDAAIGRFQQLMLEQLFAARGKQKLSISDLQKAASALNTAASARERTELLKERYEARARKAAAAAEKAIRKGKSASVTIAEVRAALTLPPEVEENARVESKDEIGG